ncbi:MAG: hypothetical protein GTO45_14760 [Candidatus Aminicenantes bacterium]|nr:hypothetical protein [Candidatus Aminicenantes bacterium]NIM80015.1 hypothetical protein [Candidatus Aminicenantes bacterium]NIN19369.1 hypothetical protein [Candidatus Aminicenantes bacterium]NIN43268.1 hypothetical protein [Candidatus Aminicenantes bacterium]NIN86010.1 hypothetical protein [Candidatus Aminicenantes bacterium]
MARIIDLDKVKAGTTREEDSSSTTIPGDPVCVSGDTPQGTDSSCGWDWSCQGVDQVCKIDFGCAGDEAPCGIDFGCQGAA